MNSVPFIGNLNFSVLEEVGRVIFQDHHRQQIQLILTDYHNSILGPDMASEIRERRNQHRKIAKITRQLIELLEGKRCALVLRLWKQDLKDLAERAESLYHGNKRGRPRARNPSWTVCQIFEVYKDAGGKGIGCYWDEIDGIFKGNTLELICALFDQSNIQYSKNMVAKHIKFVGEVLNVYKKVKAGVQGYKIIEKPPIPMERFQEFINQYGVPDTDIDWFSPIPNRPLTLLLKRDPPKQAKAHP